MAGHFIGPPDSASRPGFGVMIPVRRARRVFEECHIEPGTKLVVVGQGYVGLPLALRAVEAGYRVVGFDLDVDRVKRLADGDSYVEDVPRRAAGDALATGRYRPDRRPRRAWPASTWPSSTCPPRWRRASPT